jgi:nitrogenase molybdenum-cofactor synthesis protein NifE
MSKNISISVSKPRGGVYTAMAKAPGIHLLFVGALACTRHRSNELVELQKQGRLSFLCLDEVDFVTGNYITKIEQSITEIVNEAHPSGILIAPGCQSALLSTDYKLMVDKLTKELGVPICVHEACHLCGLESDTSAGKPDTIEQMIFDFLSPSDKSSEPSLNIISSTPLDHSSELFALLEGAGITVNEIENCKTFEEYQKMASAHLNIICANDAAALGEYLKNKLNIPYVVLQDVYSSDELSAVYAAIGKTIGVELEVSEYANALNEKLSSIKGKLSDVSIDVSGSPSVAKWFVEAGIPVGSVSYNPRAPIPGELVEWFKKNSPETEIKVASFKGGKPGGGRPQKGNFEGKHGRPNGERPWGGKHERPQGGKQGWGRPGTGTLKVGFAASEDVLNDLVNLIRSAE